MVNSGPLVVHLIVCLFFIVSLTNGEKCNISTPPMFPPFKRNFSIHYSTKCRRYSIEESLFRHGDITLLDGHNEALYYWLDLGLLKCGKKFTLLHIDSRISDCDLIFRCRYESSGRNNYGSLPRCIPLGKTAVAKN
jgi:hypothetical protein